MQTYFSLRVVKANSEEEAVEQILQGNFDEQNPLCDIVVPASSLKIKLKELKTKIKEGEI